MYQFLKHFIGLFLVGMVTLIVLDQVDYGATMHYINFTRNLKMSALLSGLVSGFLWGIRWSHKKITS